MPEADPMCRQSPPCFVRGQMSVSARESHQPISPPLWPAPREIGPIRTALAILESPSEGGRGNLQGRRDPARGQARPSKRAGQRNNRRTPKDRRACLRPRGHLLPRRKESARTGSVSWWPRNTLGVYTYALGTVTKKRAFPNSSQTAHRHTTAFRKY